MLPSVLSILGPPFQKASWKVKGCHCKGNFKSGEGLPGRWRLPSGGLLSFPGCPTGTSQPWKVCQQKFSPQKIQRSNLDSFWEVAICRSVGASRLPFPHTPNSPGEPKWKDIPPRELVLLLDADRAHLRSLESSSVSVFWADFAIWVIWAGFATSFGRQATLPNNTPSINAIGAFMVSLERFLFAMSWK